MDSYILILIRILLTAIVAMSIGYWLYSLVIGPLWTYIKVKPKHKLTNRKGVNPNFLPAGKIKNLRS